MPWNTGVDGGQEVYHLHLHLVGGRPLSASAMALMLGTRPPNDAAPAACPLASCRKATASRARPAAAGAAPMADEHQPLRRRVAARILAYAQ